MRGWKDFPWDNQPISFGSGGVHRGNLEYIWHGNIWQNSCITFTFKISFCWVFKKAIVWFCCVPFCNILKFLNSLMVFPSLTECLSQLWWPLQMSQHEVPPPHPPSPPTPHPVPRTPLPPLWLSHTTSFIWADQGIWGWGLHGSFVRLGGDDLTDYF